MSPVTRGRHDLWGGLLLVFGVVLVTTALVGVSLFQIGAAAFFVWLALARNQGWAWIPAAIFGFQVAGDLFDGVGGSLSFPLLVIAAGVLMLSRGRLSKQATIGILVLLAVVGIASNNDDARSRDNGPANDAGAKVMQAVDRTTQPELADLPALKGRDLIVFAGDTDLSVGRSRSARAGISTDKIEIRDEPGALTVIVGDSDELVEMTVPAESQVLIRTGGGDVRAALSLIRGLDIDTVSGDVDIELEGVYGVTAETSHGDLAYEGLKDYDPAPNVLVTEAAEKRVRVRSLDGSIAISQREARQAA